VTAATGLVAAGTWTADLAYTRATFTARHRVGPPVHGTISVLSGTVEVGDDGHPARLEATLDPASVDTGHPRRDRDLRGARFLAAGSYPRLVVVADGITVTADGWSAAARLCGRGREAPLPVSARPDGPAAGGSLHVTATARLDLRDLGIRPPTVLMRRLVEVSVSARLTRQA
jgi:polyisoprenoid-binding protein YceI